MEDEYIVINEKYFRDKIKLMQETPNYGGISNDILKGVIDGIKYCLDTSTKLTPIVSDAWDTSKIISPANDEYSKIEYIKNLKISI